MPLASRAEKEKSRKPLWLRLFRQLPRLDSNQDKESQKVFPSHHKSHSKKAFGNDAIPFDAGLRENLNPIVLDAEMRLVLDAWPTLPEPLRAGILAMISAARK